MRYVVIPITELTPAPEGARCNVKGTAYIADTDVESEYTMTHEEALMFVDYDTTGFKSVDVITDPVPEEVTPPEEEPAV